MYVGGLEASAGGSASPAGYPVGLQPPFRGELRERNHLASRAASGAARGREHGVRWIDPPCVAGTAYVVKTAIDRLLAALGLLLLAPVLLLIAAAVRCSSRGPALYVQERIGRHGVPFRMLKFRSMVLGAEEHLAELAGQNVAAGPLFKVPDDPRVTRFGRWLRRFSLDELPQLVNVLTGSMSLVGPRPPLATEVATYALDVRRRLLVKPGLTGLWQVSGRSDLSWDEAVRLDLHYVDNWSLALDLQLLVRTARVVVTARGAY